MKLLCHISLVICMVINTSYVLGKENSRKALSRKVGLVKVYYDAVDNNADLAAAKAQYRAKQEVVPQARAGLLPQINADASYGDTRTALDEPPATTKRNTHLYQINLSQPIFRVDRWFKLKAAHATSEQASLDFAFTQQQLILQAAKAYFAVLQAQDNLAATKAEEEAYKQQCDQSNERYKLGLSDRTDYLQAKAAYDMSRASRIKAEQVVEDSFQALTTLTDKNYDALQGVRHSLPVKPPMPNDAKLWVDKAVEQNISLQASFYGVTAAQETLKQKKAGHAPTVDLVAAYKKGDNDAFNFGNSSSKAAHYGSDVEQRSIGLQLQVPIYSGGMTSSQVREAHSTLMMSEHQQEGLRRKVVENTRDYHRAVNTDVNQIAALKQTIISSLSAVEATTIGFQVGTRNIVDVLDAQRRLYDAARNYNNARYAYIIDSLSLKESVGTLSPFDLQELEAYLKADYNPDKDFLPADLLKKGKVLK